MFLYKLKCVYLANLVYATVDLLYKAIPQISHIVVPVQGQTVRPETINCTNDLHVLPDQYWNCYQSDAENIQGGANCFRELAQIALVYSVFEFRFLYCKVDDLKS